MNAPQKTLALMLALAGCSTHADPAVAAVDFVSQVQPILTARCGKCHGESRALGRLRLDSAEGIQSFSKSTLIVAGKPDESSLVLRISLPPDDKKRMPKGGDPLRAEEIGIIRRWVVEGAALTSAGPTATPVTEAPTTPADAAAAAPPDDDPDADLASVPPAAQEAIDQLVAAGASVMPLFAGSPLLQVSFSQSPSPPRDDAVSLLPLAAEQIVSLDLSGAQATSAGYAPLVKLVNLQRLHMEKSTIDDNALASLVGLRRLTYLNLYDTAVGDAGLEHLKSLARLRKLYLWRSKASYDAAMALQAAIPGLSADVGADHPAVVRLRLTQLRDLAKADVEATGARVAELEAQLKAAQEARDKAVARQREIDEQLESLDAPSDESEGENAAAAAADAG